MQAARADQPRQQTCPLASITSCAAYCASRSAVRAGRHDRGPAHRHGAVRHITNAIACHREQVGVNEQDIDKVTHNNPYTDLNLQAKRGRRGVFAAVVLAWL